jgi:hypothetical protein
VAVENGRQLATHTAAATSVGHLELVRWADRFPVRRFALEDCRDLSRQFRGPGAQAHGWYPAFRTRARQQRPIDALAVARTALREPDLPVPRLHGPEREVRLLVDHREMLRSGSPWLARASLQTSRQTSVQAAAREPRMPKRPR